jgi:hypothetical protein
MFFSKKKSIWQEIGNWGWVQIEGLIQSRMFVRSKSQNLPNIHVHPFSWDSIRNGVIRQAGNDFNCNSDTGEGWKGGEGGASAFGTRLRKYLEEGQGG